NALQVLTLSSRRSTSWPSLRVLFRSPCLARHGPRAWESWQGIALRLRRFEILGLRMDLGCNAGPGGIEVWDVCMELEQRQQKRGSPRCRFRVGSWREL